MRSAAWMLIGLAACSGRAPESSTPAPHEPEPEQPQSEPMVACLAVWTYDGSDSVLEPLRGCDDPDLACYDNPLRFTAVEVDPASDRIVEAVGQFRIHGRPLLWYRPHPTEWTIGVVDATVLTDLQLIDVMWLRGGERVVLGALTEVGRGQLGGRELAEFLLRAQVLGTYIHAGSTVCLFEEHEDEDGYRARFTAVHEYYTNEACLDPFGFVLEIGVDGSIAVTDAESREFAEAHERRNRRRGLHPCARE